jgi:hypothetical protein
VVFVFLSFVLLSVICLRRHGRRASEIAERTGNLQGLFLKPELEAGNSKVKTEKPIATNEISQLDTSPASVSKYQNQDLGLVEDILIPEDEGPRTVEMEAPKAPESFVIQSLPSTLRTPVVRKSVPAEPENNPPQAQTSPSEPSDTLPNERGQMPIQNNTSLPDSEMNPSSASLEAEIERIREERERLSRLMELDRIEERLRQQLQARNSGA